jgi:hypothetical protein
VILSSKEEEGMSRRADLLAHDDSEVLERDMLDDQA